MNAGVTSPVPSSGDLPHPRIKPGSPALQEDSLPAELPEKPICMSTYVYMYVYVYLLSFHIPFAGFDKECDFQL